MDLLEVADLADVDTSDGSKVVFHRYYAEISLRFSSMRSLVAVMIGLVLSVTSISIPRSWPGNFLNYMD